MGVCVGGTVGDGAKLDAGMGVKVDGRGVNVSAEMMPVDVEAGSPCGEDAVESEAGVPPVVPRLQASVVNIRMMGRIYFEFFMA